MATPPRLSQIFSRYPIFFVTACTHDRRRILAQSVVHESFAGFVLESAHHGVFVGRYVLMPDHLHLFAGFGPNSMSLSTWMKSLKNAISKSLISTKCLGPHWQKGFFDRVLRSQDSYEQKWLYVRDNPVRAGFVGKAEEWPYAGEIFSVGHDE